MPMSNHANLAYAYVGGLDEILVCDTHITFYQMNEISTYEGSSLTCLGLGLNRQGRTFYEAKQTATSGPGPRRGQKKYIIYCL